MNLREVEVFKPYTDEFPETLLLAEEADDACLDRWQVAEILRIAKRGTEILGVYAMNRTDALHFDLLGVVVALGIEVNHCRARARR